MENEVLLKKIQKKGIDPDHLTNDDIKTLIEMNIQGQIEKEILKEFLKESNITYKTFVEGLKTFIDSHKSSSNKYMEALDYRMKGLMKQAENANTPEDKEKVDKEIDIILDRLKEEVDSNRKHTLKVVMVAGGIGTILAGSAIFIATRNPEVLKKGVEMIAKETVKQIV
ncbi:hypothetical protein [Metabacillus schmidteae]|uniref:hypothetical protein n=1 Tax=Metabacillus schmidteae TaxID=2730405 RepID=UPI00158888C2|nr:hypothetical protein [Metabacillus schmidteae]